MESRSLTLKQSFDQLLTDSITGMYFRDPVHSPCCGQTFERELYTFWVEKEHTCPICRAEVDATEIVTNNLFKLLMNNLLEWLPEFRDHQYPISLYTLYEEKKYDQLIDIYKHNNFNLYVQVFHGETVLHIAARKGNLSLLEKLAQVIPHIHWNVRSSDSLWENATPLYCALLQNSSDPLAKETQSAPVELLRFLLAQGADPTLVTSDGYTPLMQAARNGQEECVFELLKHPQVVRTINNTDVEGDAALLSAVRSCSAKVVKAFLCLPEINPNLTNSEGEFPLYVAAELGDLEKVEILLSIPGIDAYAVNTESGLTAQEIANKKNHTVICNLLSLFNTKKMEQKEFNDSAKSLSSSHEMQWLPFPEEEQEKCLEPIQQSMKSTLAQLCEESAHVSFLKFMQEGKILSHLICPISKKLFLNPVTTEKGETFEREALENCIRSGKYRPESVAPISNRILQEVVGIILEHFPEYKSMQYHSHVQEEHESCAEEPTDTAPVSQAASSSEEATIQSSSALQNNSVFQVVHHQNHELCAPSHSRSALPA